ncbi:MAG: RNA methyltransferase [Pseudomonadota bacterium]
MVGQRISRSKAGALAGAAPIFVLVDPQMGENIGATARAMLNFGVTGLRLVRPRDGWPNPKAAAMASGASAVIDGAQVFETLDQALGDCRYVAATTARRREVSLPVLDADAAAREMRKRVDAGERCAVLFGGERNGLSTDDLARADAIVSIPVNPAFASINLAQAALIVAYEWGQAGAVPALDDAQVDERPASRKDVQRLYEHLETELDAAGYFFPEEMRETMARNIRVALTRAGFTEGEARTLRGVVKALARNGKGRSE